MGYMSVRELFERREELLPLPWSYKTILKYVCVEYPHIFKPTSKGKGTGKRYYIKEDAVKEFTKKFQNNKLQ